MYVYMYIHRYTYIVCIYIEREREIISLSLSLCIYIYIYIYRCWEQRELPGSPRISIRLPPRSPRPAFPGIRCVCPRTTQNYQNYPELPKTTNNYAKLASNYPELP